MKTKFELLEKDQERLREINKAFEKFWESCDDYEKSLNFGSNSILKAREAWKYRSIKLMEKLKEKAKADKEEMMKRLRAELIRLFGFSVEPKQIRVSFNKYILEQSVERDICDGYYVIINAKRISYPALKKLSKQWDIMDLKPVGEYIQYEAWHLKVERAD
jgi:hypothetical protein